MKKDKWLYFILYLNKKTQNKDVEWETISPVTSLYDMKERVIIMFKIKYNNKNIYLFECNYDKKYIKPPKRKNILGLGAAQTIWNKNIEEEEFETIVHKEIRLIITDENNQSYWKIPYYSAINDLYETVTYFTSGAKDIYDSLE